MKKKLSFREIRYREKRQKILQQAATVFAKKGYEKSSLEEIASRLKLSKASLYHYVKSKDEVLFLIQLDALEALLAVAQDVSTSGQSPPDKMRSIVMEYIKIATQKHVVGALRQQELILPEKWRKKIIDKRDLFDNTCRQIIIQGIESGEFTAVDWKMSYMAMIGALNWTVKWYSPQGSLSVDDICAAMADFVLKGFGVPSSTT